MRTIAAHVKKSLVHRAVAKKRARLYSGPKDLLDQTKGDDVTETQMFLKLIESIGFPALIFAVWYLYHRSQVKAWEAREVSQAEAVKAQMQTMSDHEARMFTLLNGQLEALQCLVGQVARVESKIDTNQHCPIIRKESHA